MGIVSAARDARQHPRIGADVRQPMNQASQPAPHRPRVRAAAEPAARTRATYQVGVRLQAIAE